MTTDMWSRKSVIIVESLGLFFKNGDAMFESRLRNRPPVHKRQLNVFSITLIFVMLTRLSSMDKN